MAHAGEVVIPSDLTKDFAKLFSSPEAKIIGEVGRIREAANIMNTMNITLNQNNTFQGGVKEAQSEISFLGLQMKKEVFEIMNEGLETGQVNSEKARQ